MSSKEELAALMASDGDYEKKISLLKKAVVTVTKQKQEVEARNAQLQEELRTTTQQLRDAQRESATLQRRVKALEAQLEQEKGGGGGSAFGQNMLKGLSSIMGNNDAGGRGGGAGGGRGGRGGGTSGSKLALSAEDVERLVTENEQLHREKYTYKTKMEDAQRGAAREVESMKAEVTQLQKSLAELHSTLDAVTGQCDSLNADCRAERAAGDFCRHFFAVALRRSGGCEKASGWSGQEGLPVTAELRWPSAAASDALPADVKEEVVRALQSCSGTVKTLLRGVSVLVVMLREQLPRRERATVGDLEWLRDRLSVFLDAHTLKKDRLMHLLDQLDSLLSTALSLRSDKEHVSSGTGGGGGDAATGKAVLWAQEEMLQLFLEWVTLLRAQTPLLVESCVSYLPQGHTYAMQTGRNAATTMTTSNRAEFVEELTKHGCTTLASIEGSLAALKALLERSPAAYRCSSATTSPSAGRDAHESGSSVDLYALLALQRFWWEGCAAARALHTSVIALDGGVRCLAEGCDKSEIRDALTFLSRCLRSLAVASAAAEGGKEGRDADVAIAALQGNGVGGGGGERGAHASTGATFSSIAPAPSQPVSSPSRVNAGSVPSSSGLSLQRENRAPLEAYEEVLVALSAADRAAAAYHTQMNFLYLEMADREDALQTAAEAAQRLRELLEMERAEAEQTRQTMQAQISLLSNQLIEMADAAQAQQVQRPR